MEIKITIYLISILTSYVVLKIAGKNDKVPNSWGFVIFKLFVSLIPIINIIMSIIIYIGSLNLKIKREPPNWL